MILSDAEILKSTEGGLTLRISSELLAMVNIRRDTPVHIYYEKSQNENGSVQLFISSLRLSGSIVFCRLDIKNVPGELQKVTAALAGCGVNIVKAGGITVSKAGIVEMVLDTKETSISSLDKRLKKLVAAGVILEPSTELLTEIIAAERFNQSTSASFVWSKSESSGRVVMEERFVKQLGIQVKRGDGNSWAVLTAYSRVPVIGVLIYPSESKLVSIELELIDKPGSLNAVLSSVKELANLVAADGVAYPDKASWNAYLTAEEGHSEAEIKSALEKCKSVITGSVKTRSLA
jgi:ACT domain-containing protein